MKRVVEVCCGSYYDAKQAALGGAERIELNSGLMLGGLTPTASAVRLVKRDFPKLFGESDAPHAAFYIGGEIGGVILKPSCNKYKV